MAQNLSDWMPFLISGGGLLFTVVAWTAKGIIDKKEAHIQHLKERNAQLTADLKAEREKITRQVDNFSAQLALLQSEHPEEVNLLLFQKIQTASEGIKACLTEGYVDCRHAASWLRTCKTDWVRESSEVATNKYHNLIPKSKKRRFREELACYLDWAINNLDKGGKTNTPLTEFVKTQTLSSPHPYLFAISYLKECNRYGELTPKQTQYLQEMLNQLIEKLRERIH
ncbi:MAG: hypothetical protein AAF528_00200 [Cyanobacteria bacterium P01_C01_bin.121]